MKCGLKKQRELKSSLEQVVFAILRVWQVFQNVVYTEEQASLVHIQKNAPTSNPYSSSFYQLIQNDSLLDCCVHKGN
jgi:hypothetical protein